MKKELDPEPVPDPLVRVTDPGIRIRTKMSEDPQHWYCLYCGSRSAFHFFGLRAFGILIYNFFLKKG
jgi:hypothetical protein